MRGREHKSPGENMKTSRLELGFYCMGGQECKAFVCLSLNIKRQEDPSSVLRTWIPRQLVLELFM